MLLALAALIIVGCDRAMDSLNIVNGSKFIVKSKTKEKQIYWYRLLEVGNSWYDYYYRDTTNFEVGDTLIITVASEKNTGKRNSKNLLNN